MLKLTCAQIPAKIGDFTFNRTQIFEAAQNAQQQGAHVVLTPELSLTGYLPEDLLQRPAYRAASEAAMGQLCADLAVYPDLYVWVGTPTWFVQGGKLKAYNSAVLLRGGVELTRIHKQKLPNQAVFDELRYFVAGDAPLADQVFEIQGVKVGLLVCEDAWHPEPALHLQSLGAQVLWVMNASPFHVDKQTKRLQFFGERVAQTGLPLVSVNRVGAQDELIFDGASFALDAAGKLVMQLPMFVSSLNELVWDSDFKQWQPDMIVPIPCAQEQIYRALVQGVRDYVRISGFSKVCLGLSGGVDSALTLAVAVDALGADNVHTIMMPTRFTAQMSLDDAKEMAVRVGVRYDVIAIESLFGLYNQLLEPVFDGKPADVTEENLQARIRGVLLMAVSNKHNALVLNTGNKSELATGYCTLYGDMVGAYAVLKDIYKTQVYAICDWRNQSDSFAQRDIIPTNILTRAPSAELRDNQTDQDSLPPYEVLDEILHRYIEQRQPIATIVAAGFAPEVVQKVTRLIRINEYKRRQGALGPRVSTLAFGKDWRMPLMNGFTG